MSDYIINRESLKRHCEIMCKKFENSITSNAYSEHRFVLDLLEQTEWIPVSERLPTKEEYIANNGLFIVSNGNRTYAEYFDIYRYGTDKCFGEPTMYGFRVDRSVMAWMSLPKPYKAESEDKK